MPEDKKHLKLPHVAMIYAVSNNNVMGKNNDIPWRSPEDFEHFKNTTKGHAVVMGRKTWESLPKKPLRDRMNIVVTSQNDYEAGGAKIAANLYDAVALARKALPEATVFIIGGKSLLEEAEHIAGKIYLSCVDVTIPIDDTCVMGPKFIDSLLMSFKVVTTSVLNDGKNKNPLVLLRTYG